MPLAPLAVIMSLMLVAVLGAGPAAAAPPVGAVTTAPDGPAQSWMVADMDTGTILAGKNPTAASAPASTIKVLLAMTVLDHLDPANFARAAPVHTRVECSCAGLVPGQAYTVTQLLAAILMVSGNDAANMLGDMLGGYRAAITRMNAKAQSVGATSTRALSPSGLDGPGWESLTTPRDLGVLFRAALSYPLLAQIMAAPSAQFPSRDGVKTIHNQNQLLERYPGALGGKTGFTNLAGKTYVGAAQRGDRRLVVVQMKGSGDLYGQAMALLDWGFAQPR
ncbi:peptidase S11, D-alanyl-D-alanine carboxypeptidase 1 [Mycolicibacterium tokaiense]|uniref:Peptidase S11, D-alanyl-D-alanine carboxypeptidase 1 n=2 Tax=Mycolicibacterium tokaiense TaxID=39695 RepID=A0A378T8U7_9MYCO|nr:D-alanyl-D-alanine carboxypeptidase [Mycolicibacterium tokaiense]STZ57258.1 peptidase S11, D-alanyl-D-alanine carboxypeptidase 1 [Mycolicibacterium tokaiense]